MTVTDVPPVLEPDVGLTPVTVGTGGRGVGELVVRHWWRSCRRRSVTVTSTVPSAPAGAVAVMVVSFWTEKVAAGVAPKFTADALVRPVPVMVTGVPPVLGPEEGLTAVTVGTGSGGPAVMDTFWTWWMSLNPPVAPVKPRST